MKGEKREDMKGGSREIDERSGKREESVKVCFCPWTLVIITKLPLLSYLCHLFCV